MENIACHNLLDYREAAKYLGLSTYTLRKYVSQQRVPYIKIDRAVRFSPTDLVAWVRVRSVQPLKEEVER